MSQQYLATAGRTRTIGERVSTFHWDFAAVRQ